MSRVERHKEEYSKADREALGKARSEELEYAKLRREAAPEGRAARNRDPQAEDLGILDQTEEEKRKARKEARAMNDGRPEFNGGRAIGKLLNFLGTLILIIAIIACLGLTVPKFAGIDQYVVISGSMEPAIPVGSMVYSAQTEPSTLQQGDIIVFYANETGSTPVTHRVVENRISEGEIITKGDANEQNDISPITYANVLGKMVLHVPMLGYIAAPMATLMGKIAMVCVILAAYLLTVVGSRLSGK
jgi:signal peptidase